MVICTWRKFLGSWGKRCAMRWGKFIDFGASYPPDSYSKIPCKSDRFHDDLIRFLRLTGCRVKQLTRGAKPGIMLMYFDALGAQRVYRLRVMV